MIQTLGGCQIAGLRRVLPGLGLTLSPSTCSLQSGKSSSHTHLHLQTYQIIMFLHVFYQLHTPTTLCF